MQILPTLMFSLSVPHIRFVALLFSGPSSNHFYNFCCCVGEAAADDEDDLELDDEDELDEADDDEEGGPGESHRPAC